jgi:YesN/AraC family two-component response regulator
MKDLSGEFQPHGGVGLQHTEPPLHTEIAAEAGFENLGYFHRLFRVHHGTSPRRYRMRQRVIM